MSALSKRTARGRFSRRGFDSPSRNEAAMIGWLNQESSCKSDAARPTVKGLIADANIQGQVGYLVRRMQADAWADFWQALGLIVCRFEDVWLSGDSTDLEVWNACQAEQLGLITDNRNLDA
jgi:hypothetical protein